MPFPDRIVRIEADGLVISNRFSPALRDRLRALPGARWDRGAGVWRVPREQAATALPVLETLHYRVEGDRALLGGGAVGGGEPVDTESPSGWTLSAVHTRVGQALASAFPEEIWVMAELARVTSTRGTLYLSLVERDAAGAVLASLPAVIFPRERTAIEAALAAQGLQLEDELPVRLLGRLSNYAPRGRVQLVARGIDPGYSLGDLARRREEVLRQLAVEGLVDRNRALPVPRLPLRIALLTSAGSDAEHDVLQTLRDSAFPFEVTRIDVRVQGRDLERSVRAALAWVAAHQERMDVCVIARGGGGRAELSAWDNLAVGRAVARLPVKVLVAIGHEQDRSVLDEIAWSARTPTAAGEALVQAVRGEEAQVDALATRLVGAADRALERSEIALIQTGRRFGRSVLAVLRAERLRATTGWGERLERAALRAVRNAARRTGADGVGREHLLLRRVAQERDQLAQRARRLSRGAQGIPADAARTLGALLPRLRRGGRQQLREGEQRLVSAEAAVRLADPGRLLARGFAVVRDPKGRAVRACAALAATTEVTIALADGTVAGRWTPEPDTGGGHTGEEGT